MCVCVLCVGQSEIYPKHDLSHMGLYCFLCPHGLTTTPKLISKYGASQTGMIWYDEIMLVLEINLPLLEDVHPPYPNISRSIPLRFEGVHSCCVPPKYPRKWYMALYYIQTNTCSYVSNIL